MDPVLNDRAIGNGATELDASRTAALDAWLKRDGSSSSVSVAMQEAAACATLVDTDDGPRFAPSFGELVEFIAEMPF